MERREFILGGAFMMSGARKPLATRKVVLENSQLAWHLDTTKSSVRSTALENRLTGHTYQLATDTEFALTFALGKRAEIPWFQVQLTDSETLPDSGTWKAVHNLAGGQQGRAYTGHGWFKTMFSLPESVRGQELVFVLGGYDEQDWNEHWVHVNGQQIGHRKVTGRWRRPGRHRIRPGDPAYTLLKFGQASSNVLAIRVHEYDYHVQGISEDALEQYVFRSFLFDQFISLGEPDTRLTSFELRETRHTSPEKCSFVLEDSIRHLVVTIHYELDGFVRRKWLEVQNRSTQAALLLDVELDDFQAGSTSSEGGHGKPVFLNDDLFCAVEHPAGINQGTGGGIRLWHCPGKLIAPGETLRSCSSVVGVAAAGATLDQFHSYLYANSPRSRKGRVSIFTCFGLNNQWGACPTLNDVQVLDNQKVLAQWQQQHGVKLDFFTLDTGWPANDGDLTEFINTCYPDGPAAMIDGIHDLGMQFGLWFSEGWGGWANGSYPPIQPGAIPDAGAAADPPVNLPPAIYRNGYPAIGGTGRQMCMAADDYYTVYRKAVLHHVGENKARLIKFDSGNYYCNSTKHQHLPGKYSTEAITNRMIEIVRAARAITPELFVMWYWGEGSPFWALHGDVISESGLFMEGSGTSQFPSLYYRDSVTLSLDQNTQFAKLIPPLNKDSLGTWLSPIRWGNFMGKERWREALVMDLGRGSMVFPQLWGDPNLLNESDVAFLGEMIGLARDNEKLLQSPRRTFGDSWKNEVYGYFFNDENRSLLFCHNAHFLAREITLPTRTGKHFITHFPERAELTIAGATANSLWLRPFETLLLEARSDAPPLPPRALTEAIDKPYGSALKLESTEASPILDLTFADAGKFEKAGNKLIRQDFKAQLPELTEGRHLLAVTMKLTRNGKDYRYSPVVAEIVQIRGRLADHEIQMIPVPDARRYGNTQHAGCSWVLYKIPLNARHAREHVLLAIHGYLPAGVEARTEAWIVKQWWREETRPEPDGFYGDSPS